MISARASLISAQYAVIRSLNLRTVDLAEGVDAALTLDSIKVSALHVKQAYIVLIYTFYRLILQLFDIKIFMIPVTNQYPINTSPSYILKYVFGYDEFRGEQEEIINNVINGKNTFVLMPTGGGKSLCYQIPALALDGLAIIISPLIALMQDQVSALKLSGVKAATINSNISRQEVWQIQDAIKNNELDLLYVAPESYCRNNYDIFFFKKSLLIFCSFSWFHPCMVY